MSRPESKGIRNVGFVSTRICGTDGVSLEIDKWATILARMGYECFYVCGKCDRPAARTFLISEADFLHPDIREINRLAFGRQHRSRELSHTIHRLAGHIKNLIYKAIGQFQLDLLVVQNALTIPLNIPLGAALVEVIIESGIRCIAHHHDFVWERERYLISAVDDYLQAVFPPRLSEIEHVVINSLASAEFNRRTGLSSRIIPNVMDFANPPAPADDYASDFREKVGIGASEPLILQPTRIVARKGIEHSIELVRRLDHSACKLVVTHDAIDEGGPYLERIREFAGLMNVEIVLAAPWISDQRGMAADGTKQYAIWDVYPQADLVTYPSTYEGFGNAFLEAAYYKKPIVCNRYTIFRTDIEPCGFDAIVMDGYLTADTVRQVRRVLDDADYREQMVEHNYRAASRRFSYERVEHELAAILKKLSLAPTC